VIKTQPQWYLPSIEDAHNLLCAEDVLDVAAYPHSSVKVPQNVPYTFRQLQVLPVVLKEFGGPSKGRAKTGHQLRRKGRSPPVDRTA